MQEATIREVAAWLGRGNQYPTVRPKLDLRKLRLEELGKARICNQVSLLLCLPLRKQKAIERGPWQRRRKVLVVGNEVKILAARRGVEK
ncbi:MAG: hypothetical protein ACREX9_18405 [Gammaproteobacteria bacterium]